MSRLTINIEFMSKGIKFTLTKALENAQVSLFTFVFFERLIAAFCIFIPLILWFTDRATLYINGPTAIHTGFRPSISQYVDMQKSHVFGMVLAIAAMLFIFNGAVYYHYLDSHSKDSHKKPHGLPISLHGQWYNVVLGLSLIGVISFSCMDYMTTHCIFAAIFFFGNALVTGFFCRSEHKTISVIMAIVTAASLLIGIILHIKFNTTNGTNNYPFLLVGEWISLTVISVHFTLSTIGKGRYAKAVKSSHIK